VVVNSTLTIGSDFCSCKRPWANHLPDLLLCLCTWQLPQTTQYNSGWSSVSRAM